MENQERYKRRQFQEIADGVVELLIKKNADYGSSFDKNRKEFGSVATAIRLSDKVNRYKKLIKAEARVDESKEDTLRDIIGYCVLELAYREDE